MTAINDRLRQKIIHAMDGADMGLSGSPNQIRADAVIKALDIKVVDRTSVAKEVDEVVRAAVFAWIMGTALDQLTLQDARDIAKELADRLLPRVLTLLE